MLTMIHGNRARVEDGMLKVDRKFHAGMQSYVANIGIPIVSVHPESTLHDRTMDLVEIPVTDLGYRVLTVKTDKNLRPFPVDLVRLSDLIKRSRLVYGHGLSGAKLARASAVPYIQVLEYDLRTEIIVTTSQVSNPARKAARAARCTFDYVTLGIPDMRGALGLHCNGYPIFDESRWFNPNRLLYFDSRMTAELIISEDRLAQRLAGLERRRLRMLFSGRYERLKGADDTIRVAIECLRRGLDIELHCYGQGNLRLEMQRLAAQVADRSRIQIHDAIPFPDLVERSRTFDLFVCCHVQSDPSCTYLEAFGAGLPIVGYGNRMWRRLCAESQAGLASSIGRPKQVADDIQRLAADRPTLALMSERARRFASAHTFEREFAKRIDALNADLDRMASATTPVNPVQPPVKI